MSTPTQDKAVALATQYGVRRHGEEEGLVHDYFEFYAPQLTAMLTEQDRQSRADERQRLVDASGVMPAFRLTWHIDGARYTVSKPNIGDTDCYDSEAIASMQAQIAERDKEYAVLFRHWGEARTKLEQSEQRVRELESVLQGLLCVAITNVSPNVGGDAIECAKKALKKENG